MLQSPLLVISVSQRTSGNGVYFYNGLFRKLGLDAIYLGCKTDTLRGFRESFDFLKLHGASIAAPFKSNVIPMVDILTEDARATGSVNSVRRRDAILEGHNTDVLGLRRVLAESWQPLAKPSVVIFGSGGVVPSAVAAIRSRAPDALIALSSRNQEQGPVICAELGIDWRANLHGGSVDLWVNATPASTVDAAKIAQYCAEAAVVFDFVPLQETYPFETIVRSRGQTFIRGFDFYRAQFLEQFNFYFDCEVATNLFDELATARVSGFRADRASW